MGYHDLKPPSPLRERTTACPTTNRYQVCHCTTTIRCLTEVHIDGVVSLYNEVYKGRLESASLIAILKGLSETASDINGDICVPGQRQGQRRK